MRKDPVLIIFLAVILFLSCFIIQKYYQGVIAQKDRIIAHQEARLKSTSEMEVIVLKYAKKYHGRLFAYYDTADNTYRFISKKGPCRVFRNVNNIYNIKKKPK